MRRYTLPDYIFPKPWMYLIATLLLLNLAAATVLGVLETQKTDQSVEIVHQTVSTSTETEELPSDASGAAQAMASVLGQSEDKGQAYIDSMVFFGESTTAHLRSRGVLRGGSKTAQVWANESNTMMLSTEICKQTIIYPETGERMTVGQAAAQKKPQYLVLAFGVNGLSQFSANPAVYSLAYAKLISAVRAASPQTVILLQTVYPVASFYPDAARVNASIDALNAMLPEIAKENGAYVVDTASVLRAKDGTLREEFATEDGLHLTRAAYLEILNYLRTHGYP